MNVSFLSESYFLIFVLDYYMVNFVAPNLLGTIKDFQKKFVNPINAATTKEASDVDATNMKRRASVLWKNLEMVMHRKNFKVLANILPPKYEHLLFLRLTTVQTDLYNEFMKLRKGNRMLAQQQAFAGKFYQITVIFYIKFFR